LDLIGGGLVVFGCVGEIWILINTLSKQAEAQSKKLSGVWRVLAILEGMIKLAFTRLKLIGWELSKAKEHLLELSFVGLVALGVGMELISLPFSLWESALANERASTAELARVELEKQVGELRKANLELEARIQPRRISAEHRRAIVEQLSPLSNKCDVVVVAEVSDIEARGFAEDINDLLQQCGFDSKLSLITTMPASGSRIRTGLHLVASMSAIPSLRAILDAMKEARIPVLYHWGGLEVTNHHMDIWVNAKPVSGSSAASRPHANGFAVPAWPQP